MKLSDLLNDTAFLLNSPASELKLSARLLQQVKEDESGPEYEATLEEIIQKIQQKTGLEVELLSTGEVLLKKQE